MSQGNTQCSKEREGGALSHPALHLSRERTPQLAAIFLGSLKVQTMPP